MKYFANGCSKKQGQIKEITRLTLSCKHINKCFVSLENRIEMKAINLNRIISAPFELIYINSTFPNF